MIEYKVRVYEDRVEWRNQKDELHKLDGPAIEWKNGDKSWYVNGERHRLDGPAVEYLNGYKSWYVNDKLHRLDGPAIVYSSGTESWYIEGKLYSEEEFNKKIREMNSSYEGKIVEVDGKKYKLTKV